MDIYLAERVERLKKPHIPSVIEKCSECGAEVWVDENLVEFARTIKIVCTVCWLKNSSLLEAS